jgi:DNA-binding response OmpR family regulator
MTSTTLQKHLILCIDDQEMSVQTRQIVLEQAGYRVLIATTGAAGLELFRRELIELVITDHLLPGQTGCQMALEMKALKPEVPIVMLSGLSEPPEDASALDLFLTKGMPVPEFLATVASLLGGAACQSPQH